MPEISLPRAVLSDALRERIGERKVRVALFTTYAFDPVFFEQEILPALLDIPQSSRDRVRPVQTEYALREEVRHLAVYYDAGKLLTRRGGPVVQNYQRIPMRWNAGVFHPKVILLLLETPADSDDAESKAEFSLLVGIGSANLTQGGWWENIEVFHFEEVAAGSRSSLKQDLLSLVGLLIRKSPGTDVQPAAREIQNFLLRHEVEQLKVRSVDNEYRPRLFVKSGRESLFDFLDVQLGDELRGLSLEILSPYFDEADKDGHYPVLAEVIDRFKPAEVRVLLPKDPDGNATIPESAHRAIRRLPGVSWADMAEKGDWVRRGESGASSPRFLHAKVYRFFQPGRKREYLLFGSSNFTRPGWQTGNCEVSCLVESNPSAATDWWLKVAGKPPTVFTQQAVDGEELETQPSMPLQIRFDWSNDRAEARWDGKGDRIGLVLRCTNGVPADAGDLNSGDWRPIESAAAALREHLLQSALLEVEVRANGESTRGWILVQEHHADRKPEMLLRLTVEEILRSWTALSVAQRQMLLEARLDVQAAAEAGALPVGPRTDSIDSHFSRCAGIFQAFVALSTRIAGAISDHRLGEADALLFGKRGDSMLTLVERLKSEGERDLVSRYVGLLCALQLLRRMPVAHPDYAEAHRADLKSATALVEAVLQEIEPALASQLGGPGTPRAFLDWYRSEFLRPAAEVRR